METLVWNARLRTQRGVYNDVNLLNGQTTKWESLASVEGIGGEVVYKAGPRRQVYLGQVPEVYREPIRGFHDLL
jgi:hypothetical protein